MRSRGFCFYCTTIPVLLPFILVSLLASHPFVFRMSLHLASSERSHRPSRLPWRPPKEKGEIRVDTKWPTVQVGIIPSMSVYLVVSTYFSPKDDDIICGVCVFSNSVQRLGPVLYPRRVRGSAEDAQPKAR
jgi:hypothetical protein